MTLGTEHIPNVFHIGRVTADVTGVIVEAGPVQRDARALAVIPAARQPGDLAGNPFVQIEDLVAVHWAPRARSYWRTAAA